MELPCYYVSRYIVVRTIHPVSAGVKTRNGAIALAAAYVRLGRRLWIVILVHGYLDTVPFAQIFLGATGA
jgi:hypothetical protein